MLCGSILDNSMCNYWLFGFFHYHPQFWYGPEIYQNTSKRCIDNSVDWVARWNKSCCRARIFWLFRRMQPINVVQFYSIDNDISSKMSVFTGNLDIFHIFSLSTITNRHFKFNTNTLSNYLNGKTVGMVPISNILFLRNSPNLPICQKLPFRLAAWSSRSEKNLKVGPGCCQNLCITIIKQNGQCLRMIFVGLIWIWILMLVEHVCLMYSAYILFTYCVYSLHAYSK